jgi:hypothetical protein
MPLLELKRWFQAAIRKNKEEENRGKHPSQIEQDAETEEERNQAIAMYAAEQAKKGIRV